MPEVSMRLPGSRRRVTIDVGPDFADAIERSGGRYEPHLVGLVAAHLPQDGVAIDVGANAGVLSISMAHIASRGRIVAFEAAPANADRLVANVARAGVPNVRVERAALYDRSTELAVDYSDDSTGGASVTDAAGGIRTTAVSLDDWWDGAGLTRLDLVKIDVEGSELRVLRGARGTLARFRPTVLIECNPVTLARQDGATADDLVGELAGLGYRVGWITGRGGVIPMEDRSVLARALAAVGIVDLIASTEPAPAPRGLQALAGVLRARSRMRTAGRRGRPPPDRFALDREAALAVDPAPQTASPGARMELEVTVTNRGRGWISSDFRTYPIYVTHRWIDHDGRWDGDEPRTRLPHPVPPGGRCAVPLAVAAPGTPGPWTLVIRAVQEHFAWLDDLDPTLAVRLPIAVDGEPRR